jgi:hypothetical protein
MEQFEKDALKYASNMAGEYIEYLGVTDMASYNDAQWRGLVECIAMAFANKRAELIAY